MNLLKNILINNIIFRGTLPMYNPKKEFHLKFKVLSNTSICFTTSDQKK